MKKTLLYPLMLGALLAFLPVASMAQVIWTGYDQPNNVSLEWRRPELSQMDKVSFASSALFLSGRITVQDQIRVAADVPFSYFNADVGFTSTNVSDFAVGNPYLGVEVGALDGAFWGEAGVRVPLAPENNEATIMGIYGDYDRCEAFMPNVASVMAFGNYLYRNVSGFSARLRGGPMASIRTKDTGLADKTELYVLYSAQGWYDFQQVRVGAGITGRLHATESYDKFGDRMANQVGASLIAKFPGIQPGVHFSLPVQGSLTDVFDFIVGLSATVPLP